MLDIDFVKAVSAVTDAIKLAFRRKDPSTKQELEEAGVKVLDQDQNDPTDFYSRMTRRNHRDEV